MVENLELTLVLFLWTNTMKQMEALRERFVADEDAKSVTLNVLQIGYMFDTWRDKLAPAAAAK